MVSNVEILKRTNVLVNMCSLKSAESESALFYDKLKSAEKALKKSMQEEASGRQQTAADQEIISFLDLKVELRFIQYLI